MLGLGMSYVCASCGNRGTWLFQRLTLHVDHINGLYYHDNRPENLRFLCPNCHAVTPTHAGKNRVRLGERLGSRRRSPSREMPTGRPATPSAARCAPPSQAALAVPVRRASRVPGGDLNPHALSDT